MPHAPTTSPLDRAAALAGPVLILALAAWFASWTGVGSRSVGPLVWTVISALPAAIVWLLGAAGLGWPLRRWLAPGVASPLIVQAALGCAAMLALDSALGRLGLLSLGGGLGAWILSVAGTALLGLQAHARRRLARKRGERWTTPLPSQVLWCAAPAVAVLLVAACSAPGWLWASEFAGYDAMSYHLQLPAEWLAAGRITGLEHNVYSFLPGAVEASSFHLALLHGDAVVAAVSCQLLHAATAVLAALAVGAAAARVTGSRVLGAAAAVLFLGTPWIVVVGSLAYNEMAVCFMLAVVVLLLAGEERPTAGVAAAVGVLAAAACIAKLTAVGFVAVPAAILLAWRSGPAWPARLGVAAAAGTPLLLPWGLGNLVETGNPVFPFATGALGLGHWTAEQATTWSAGHARDLGLGERVLELWRQVPRYGIGPAPDPGEPWLPQWSLLPWVGAAGLAAAAMRAGAGRRWSAALAGILLVQCVFWITFTHLQSRFLLPASVPLALGAVLGVGLVIRAPRPLATVAGAAVLFAWCAFVPWLFRHEAGGRPAALIGAAMLRTGDALPAPQRAEGARRWPEVYVNHMMPADARVHMVGEAAPLYFRGKITYQTTWDRGPLSRAMRAHGDDEVAWLRSLRDEGYTHLLVNPVMLEIWQRSGWNDPLITAARVIGAAERQATLERSFPNQVRLYRLAGAGEATGRPSD